MNIPEIWTPKGSLWHGFLGMAKRSPINDEKKNSSDGGPLVRNESPRSKYVPKRFEMECCFLYIAKL